jgi:hypothetical protein
MDFGAHLAQAIPASTAALETEHAAMAGELPSRPAPTGLPVVAPPPMPAPIEPPATPSLPAVAPAADAGHADDLSRQGGAAINEAAAGAQVALPPTTAMIHPVGTPPPLAALEVAPVATSAGPLPPPFLVGTRTEREALNASMNAEVRESTSRALTPALAASATHRLQVAATKTGAEQSLATAEAESVAQQHSTAGRADAEVRDLHGKWQREKADVISSHEGQIQSEAGQARAEAARTMNEAQTKAHAEAAKEQTTGAQRAAEPGLWDRITSAGRGVVAGVGQLAAGALSIVRGILDEARKRVVGLLTRLGQAIRERVNAAVRTLRDGVRRVSAAMSDAIRRGREVVGKIAAALVAAAQRIWQAARQRLTLLWTRLTTMVGRALAAASAIAKRIANALGKVKQIVKLLGNKFLGFMAEAVKNPEEKVGRPLLAIAAPLAPAVPGKAEAIGEEKAKGGPGVAQTAVPVQRVAPAPPAPGETFWQGAKRHMKAAGETFMEHWAMNLLKLVLSILAFPITICMELPALMHELVGIFKPEPGGGDRLDHLLGVLRQVVNIAGLLVAGVGVWAFLIGLAFPPSEPFLGAGYYAISMGVLAADVVVAAAQMLNAYAGASNAKTPEQREMYLGMFSASLIGAGITAVMVALGAVATRLAKIFRGVKPEAASAPKPAAGEGAPPVSESKPPVGKGEPAKPVEPVEPPKTEPAPKPAVRDPHTAPLEGATNHEKFGVAREIILEQPPAKRLDATRTLFDRLRRESGGTWGAKESPSADGGAHWTGEGAPWIFAVDAAGNVFQGKIGPGTFVFGPGGIGINYSSLKPLGAAAPVVPAGR